MNIQMSKALSQGDQTDVVLIGKDGVAVETICSTEVAEMVEVEHSKLLRSIRTYCEYLSEAKIGLADFFIESQYIDEQKKPRPCYQVTKKGCEMIANKLTGKKGVVFTAKYIERFHQMQDYIVEKKNEFEGLSIEMQALLMLDKRSVEQDKRLTKLENTMTIDYGQQSEVQALVSKRVLSVLGGADAPAYKNKTVSSKAFREAYREIKRVFQVNSYRNIAVKDFDMAKAIIPQWQPSEELRLMINGANAQMILA